MERIRDIRSSEKVLYRQVLDLYATAVDYDPKNDISIEFFKLVQNKLHYAAHGHTAAEVIYQRADSTKPFMGLTSFSGELPTLKDISIAKNYLNEEELKVLNNLVSGNRKMLKDAGKVSHSEAIEKATKEYRKFQAEQLSPVEKEYFDTVKTLQKKAKTKEVK